MADRILIEYLPITDTTRERTLIGRSTPSPKEAISTVRKNDEAVPKHCLYICLARKYEPETEPVNEPSNCGLPDCRRFTANTR